MSDAMNLPSVNLLYLLTTHNMENITQLLFVLYLSGISLFSMIVTIYDKCISKRQNCRRIPEITLILISVLGGSAAMLLTMLIIRHKTRHLKFMLGLPIILFYQIIVVVYLNSTFSNLLF